MDLYARFGPWRFTITTPGSFSNRRVIICGDQASILDTSATVYGVSSFILQFCPFLMPFWNLLQPKTRTHLRGVDEGIPRGGCLFAPSSVERRAPEPLYPLNLHDGGHPN